MENKRREIAREKSNREENTKCVKGFKFKTEKKTSTCKMDFIQI